MTFGLFIVAGFFQPLSCICATRRPRSAVPASSDCAERTRRRSLRVENFRVFYDVDEHRHIVTVLRVLDKEQSLRFLEEVRDDDYRVGKPK